MSGRRGREGEHIKEGKNAINRTRVRPMIFRAFVLFTILTFANATGADPIPIIDAHSQLDHKSDLERVVPMLDEAGVSRVLLATRGRRSWFDIVDLNRRFPDRITPSVRTKGGHYNRNLPKYYRMLKAQLEHPGFGAMAEIIIWHAAKGDRAPLQDIAIAAPQAQAAIKDALKKGWPAVIHIEFADADRNHKYEHFMAELAKLLRAHPDHPFALIHMGQLTAGAAKSLFAGHPNIYFLTSHANTVVTDKSSQPWTDMFEGGDRLAPKWQELVTAHPDRFIMAFDNVWPEHWSDIYAEQVRLWRKGLEALPHEVAHMIAHGNAERLWKLPAARFVKPKD